MFTVKRIWFFPCSQSFFIVPWAERNAQMCFSYHFASGICRPLSFHILIFFSKTAEQNWTKLGHDTPYMAFPPKTASGDFVLHPKWLPWSLIGWKIGNLWKSSSEPLNGMIPNLGPTVIVWPLSKLCPFIPSIIQDGRHGWLCNTIILSFWNPI